MEILQKKGPKRDSSNSAAAFKQLQVLEGRQDRDPRNVQAHITNEAAMALWGIIVNTRNKINPLKHWNNAVWFYLWLIVEPDTAHCILLAFIPIVPKDVSLAKPNGYKWVKLEEIFTSPELGRVIGMRLVTEGTLWLIVRCDLF